MPNFSAENNCHRVRKIESEMHSEYLFEVKQEDSLQQRPKNQKQISLQEILFWINHILRIENDWESIQLFAQSKPISHE